MIVGGRLFYNDNAYNFQKVLKDVVATYGIPDKFYVDNGCSYANTQLSLICGAIGTVLLHTKVRDGASKGKDELLLDYIVSITLLFILALKKHRLLVIKTRKITSELLLLMTGK